MVINLIKKKFYLIILTNFRSKILIIFNIKIIEKLNSLIYQIKPKNKSKSKRKTRLKDII